MAERKIRARYAVRKLGKENVTYNKATMNKETRSMELEEVTEERDCYMVYFPQGHSIRLTSFKALQELGFDKKPRMVDMDTGDVVDVGGDPYDFVDDANPHNVHIIDEDEDLPLKRKKSASEHANV